MSDYFSKARQAEADIATGGQDQDRLRRNIDSLRNVVGQQDLVQQRKVDPHGCVLVTEVQGKITGDSFGKTLGEGATLEQVTVAGHPGYWIAGTPHVFFFIDAAGSVRYETLRLAANTLLIDKGGTILRIEGDLTKGQALKIAASFS